MKKDYSWPASQLDDDDMAILYKIKQQVKKPITVLIKEAVQKQYAKRKES
ncbi:MAG: hypothetical protein ISS81_01410 [Candidatus Marinimicrobia bacterium]|nr:hypothetical protein [Candidatus Neomarinimicrobiota bacterium]